MPSPWSAEESVIAFYFISRGMPYDVSRGVIKLRCGTDRNRTMCQNRVRYIRKKLSKDPFNPTTLGYDLGIVDEWLSHQVDIEKLKALVAIDAEVQEILHEYV